MFILSTGDFLLKSSTPDWNNIRGIEVYLLSDIKGLFREMAEKHFMQMLEIEGFASFQITSQAYPHIDGGWQQIHITSDSYLMLLFITQFHSYSILQDNIHKMNRKSENINILFFLFRRYYVVCLPSYSAGIGEFSSLIQHFYNKTRAYFMDIYLNYIRIYSWLCI